MRECDAHNGNPRALRRVLLTARSLTTAERTQGTSYLGACVMLTTVPACLPMATHTEMNARAYDAHAREWADRIDDDPGHKYLEKPAMERELAADLSHQDVLCIGVGAGTELRMLLSRKAKGIVGIDTSRELLGIASSRHPSVECRHMDMMAMSFADRSFDLVYSSLAFHYANDWDRLFAEIHRVLRPGGTVLFSTHHPGYWSRKARTGNSFTNRRGVTLTEHVATLPVANVEIVYYNHADEQSIAASVRHAGFTLRSCFAPSVIPLTSAQYEALTDRERASYEEIVAKNVPLALFLVVRGTT